MIRHWATVSISFYPLARWGRYVAADFAEFGRRGRRRHRRAEARAKAEAGAKLDEVRRALLVKIRKFVNDEREWLDAPRVGRELI